jgi:hypothetical protein
MKCLHLVFPLVTAALLVACSDVGTSPSPGGTSAFKDDFLSLSVDADKAYSDRPVTFTVRCTTLINGKGRVWFHAYCDRYPGEIRVESPVVTTLVHDSIWEVPIPATFVANQPFEMPIRCRFLQEDVSCFYYAVTTLDSVFVVDSNRYFWVNSETVQNLSPNHEGYISQLPNKGGTQSLYPP